MPLTIEQMKANGAAFKAAELQKDIDAITRSLHDMNAIMARLNKRGLLKEADLLHAPRLAMIGKRHDLVTARKAFAG